VLRVRVFTAPGSGLPADTSKATLELSALGDFEPGNESAEVLPAERAGASLRFPAATRAVQARLSVSGRRLAGYGERRGDAALSILLWPEQECPVLAGSGYPGPGGGQALGFSETLGALFVAGGDRPTETDAILGTLVLHTGTGQVDRGGVDAGGLQQPRAFATASAFGEGFLVAGGQKPVQGVPEAELEVHSTAEVHGTERDELLTLQNSRTHHAAVTLVDGRTLLVGGRTKVGSVSIAQYQLELVDPAERRSRIGDAIAPRIAPTALLLTDGRVFVGGGTLLDGSLSAPVGEWLTADGRRDDTKLSAEVPARFERAFVALAGGGVLAVGGCEDRPPSSEADAAACSACASGCKPLDGYDAWWIDADGSASPVQLPGIAAPRPRLLAGTDGSPWLVASDESDPGRLRLFRFNPWASRFEPAPVRSDLRLPAPGIPALSLAPDTFVWMDESSSGGELVGVRLGARSRFTRDVALVLSSEPLDPLRPAHLVPVRPLRDSGTHYDGALTLTDPGLAVLVADTDYADVTLRLGVAGEGLPRVLLGSTALGGDACPWPDGEARGGVAEQPTVVRRGDRAELSYRGGRSAACRVESGRLTVALAAGERVAVVRELQITREAAPATAF
jgi:hypothetical protein